MPEEFDIKKALEKLEELEQLEMDVDEFLDSVFIPMPIVVGTEVLAMEQVDYDDEDYGNFYDEEANEEYEIGCDIPDTCIHPSYHHYRYECYTAEDMAAQDKYYTEQNRIDNSRLWAFWYSMRDFFSQRFLRSLLELPEDYNGELPF